jgi:hypothetical protein
MKSTKDPKRRGERTRSGRKHARRDAMTLHPLGPGAFPAGLGEAILAAFRGFDPTGPWSAMAPRIVPVLKRRHHPYPADAAPLQICVPPGIWTGFGVDLGPAFSHVSDALVEGWGIDHATLLATALDNLAALVRAEPPVIERLELDGVALTAVQGQGWGSALILAPDLLRRIIGPEPRVLLAPVRNTLLSLPDDVDADLTIDLWDAIAIGAHDELDVDPLRWTGSTVTLLGGRALGLPN